MSLRFRLSELVLTVGLFLLLIPWPLQIGPMRVSSTDLSALFGWAYILRSVGAAPRLRASGRLLVFLGAFALFQVLGTLAWISHTGDRATPQLVWHIFKNVWAFSPFPIIGAMLAYSPERLQRHFVRTILGLTCLIALLGIVQTLTGGRLMSGILTNQRYLGFLTPLPADLYTIFIPNLEVAKAIGGDSYFVGSIFRSHGPFAHANPYSSMLAALGGFALAFILMGRQLPVTRLQKTTVVLVFTAMLSTLGLAGYAALGITTAYALVVRYSVTLRALVRPSLLLVLAAALAGGLIWVVMSPKPLMEQIPAPLAQRLSRLTTVQQSGGFNGRFRAWSLVVERVAESPLLGTDRHVTVREAGWADQDTPLGSHNTYLVVALYNGVPAALVFLVMLLYSIRQSWVVYRRGVDAQMRALGLACHLGFVALAIGGMAQDWIWEASIGGLFWIWAALSVGLAGRLAIPKPIARPVVNLGAPASDQTGPATS